MRHHKTILKNGIRLITIPMKGNPTVTVAITANVGSRYEDKSNNGITHFLEHLIFKGTEEMNSKEITLELDKLGADFNAHTNSEETCFWARTGKRSFEKTFDILSDMYLNSNIPAEELKKERGVILEEINMCEDNVRRKAYDTFSELMYPNQALGRTTLGTKENVKKLTREQFINYKNKYYTGANTTVVIAGDVTTAQAKKMVEKTFADIKPGKFIKPKLVIEKQKTPQVKIFNKKSDQTHMILGFRAFDTYHKDCKKLGVLRVVLGASMSSRLFSKMREELGICYYCYAANSYSFDSGYTAIFSGVGNKRVDEAITGILEILRDLKENEIPKAELEKAKNIMINRLQMNLETSSDYANFYGDQEVMREDVETPAQVIQKIKSVTAGDLQKLATQIYVPEKMNLAIVGPHKDPKKFKKLLKI